MSRLICLLVALLLAGCIPSQKPVSCNEIANLRMQIGKEFTLESLRIWIHDTYQVPHENIQEDITTDGKSRILQWGDPDHTYYSAFLRQLVLEDITLGGVQATAENVIACLDQPERYYSYRAADPGGSHVGLDLLFPGQGVLAHGARFFQSRTSELPPMDPAFPVNLFRFVRPGSAEEVLYNLFSEYSNGTYEHALKEYQPWPARWADIVVNVPR